tara:strand:- start:35827 stop:36216 length:390 start_codon:yes stop_codon:yes gene_type:complete
MFEKATRLRLRFSTSNGVVSVEDLWDLPLQTARANRASLDLIAIDLDKQLKETTTSFVSKRSTSDTELQLKFDIVKHVISVKLAEREEKENKLAKEAKKAKILSLIEKKKDAELEGTSLEDLEKQLAEL